MRRILLLTTLMAAMPAAMADDFDFAAASQPVFRDITEDITAALNSKVLSPAEAGGITGIEVGVIFNYTPVENKDSWKLATGGQEVDTIGMAGLAVRKGLPFNIDVGAFYSTVPSTDVKLYGAELRYAILAGGVATPALSLRAGYVKLNGADDFDYNNKSIDLSISKGFGPLTPYAGAGRVSGTATPKGSLAALNEEKIDATRLFVGLRFGLGLFEITPEVEKTGDNTAYNLRLGLGL